MLNDKRPPSCSPTPSKDTLLSYSKPSESPTYIYPAESLYLNFQLLSLTLLPLAVGLRESPAPLVPQSLHW